MIKRSLLQPFIVSVIALVLTFLFFIFSQYYKPIFAIRIFCVDVVGLLLVSTIYAFVKPHIKSIIKRSLLIVFIYFTCYEMVDSLIFFVKYHYINRSRTDLVEAETAVITFLMTIIIAGLVKLNQSDNKA